MSRNEHSAYSIGDVYETKIEETNKPEGAKIINC